ncbi:MAG: peroxiredoxin [Candidatus Thermoplasmatota archaeon]|nr:peroxiredoxin [Candidatus Thermoplasmatota archaeon]
MAGEYDNLLGTEFPEFSLLDDEGSMVDRNSIIGGWTVMFFYPKDHSPGCTLESCAFRDSFHEFDEAEVTLYGVSSDTVDSHADFRAKHGLQYNLLSDRSGKLVKLLGLMKRLGFLRARVTFVIDESGIIRSVYSSQINMRGHVSAALRAIGK